ncbi:hypothetical protein [Klebsiella sp. PL-2018]|uniref:hypothetical protein n=1 Tax=Klebsiella sp. PL-2018 TaxID=2851540 RepID=UPI001C226354|nr:hypothetical protein [Klebsiella sp. PL-2018]QXC99352.1 hypothetical protein MKleb_3852 [Klebsiella sp. PL-2018]
MSINKPPFDKANLDNRLAALELMVRLIVKSLSPSDNAALLRILADLELDRLKEEINPHRYPDLTQTLYDFYLQDLLPERSLELED